MSARIEELQRRLGQARSSLLEHRVYSQINHVAALRCFMEHHVFAVWDFMSLLKALQRRYTCVYVPWTPAANATIARFINEIVIGEETDEDGQGGFASHFELYRRAMTQFGADTQPIDVLNNAIHIGGSLADALSDERIPPAARRFVRHTFDVIESSDPVAILSAFTFGREDLLPAVFQRIVDELNVESSGGLAQFQYYLQRHIGLDGDEHGPMAQKLIALVCEVDEAKWKVAEETAVRSLEERLAFWDGISEAISGLTQLAGK
jgi:Protein of unknown function (DUF3050)